jgi:hypothetical protein
MATCSLCTNEIPQGLRRCPLCQTEAPASDTVYDLSGTEGDIPPNWQSTALYSLEKAARCPHCREPIRTVRVLRMTRTQVAFTSTLPRGGRAIACPQCEGILSIELSTFA